MRVLSLIRREDGFWSEGEKVVINMYFVGELELVVLTRDKFWGPIFVSSDGEDASNLDLRFVLAVESVPPLEVPD